MGEGEGGMFQEVRLFKIQYLKTKTKTPKKISNIYEVQFKNRASLFFFFARLYCDENEN